MSGDLLSVEGQLELIAITRAQERLAAALRMLTVATDVVDELADDATLGPEIQAARLGLQRTVAGLSAVNRVVTARSDNLLGPADE